MATTGLEARPRTFTSSGAIAATAVGALALIFAFLFAYDYGSVLHRNAVSAETAAIENEDVTFCGELGIGRESDLFARCKDGLASVRRAQQDRTNAAAIGIF